MSKFLYSLLCKVGLHDWTLWLADDSKPEQLIDGYHFCPRYRRCLQCGKRVEQPYIWREKVG